MASGGVNLSAGASVTPQAFTPELWTALLAEGAIIEVSAPKPSPVADYEKSTTGMIEVEATGAALRLATANGIDLADYHDIGTGQDGRITLSDVKGILNDRTN